MKQETNTSQVQISIRNLVEFLLRQGDIDNRSAKMSDAEAMQMGSKIHRKIQRQQGSEYQAEVSLKHRVSFEEFDLLVEGRADGIFLEDGQITIDEIKGILKELETITQPVPVHLAQAKCYAYIYAVQKKLDEINVQMTYCQMETQEIKYFRFHYEFEELETWFCDLTKQYKRWALFQVKWSKKRNASIQSLEFPYEYREGQKELAQSVYRSILRKKKLFVQAPTGVGKTMGVVFPAVKSMGEELGDKIFYLTAKTITRTVAEQAFETLAKQNLAFKVLTLTARDKICFLEEADCNPDACPYAKGHYDRVNNAMFECLTIQDSMKREVIEKQAKKHKVCPFELALDLSLWVDAVICDYNYVFDPNAHLRRFFAGGKKSEYLFLIDEAHNLVERGRSMYSAMLVKEDIMHAKKLVKDRFPRLAKYLEGANKELLREKRNCENYNVIDGIGPLALKLLNAYGEMEKVLEEWEPGEKREELLNFYFQVRSFMMTFDRLDDNYVIYSENGKDGKFRIFLFCINPANALSEFLDQGRSTIFFSATFLPIRYYKELLSVKEDDYAIYVPSSFPVENRSIYIGDDVTTKYTLRSPEMYQKYAQYVRRTIAAKPGKYMVFFPSYVLMNEVYQEFSKYLEPLQEQTGGSILCLMQNTDMNEEQREDFLDQFEQDSLTEKESLIGFCVLGGIFSEGIDLTDESLIGALIVGTGLPQVCNEREILKHYFDELGMRGFDYAYLYPGMNKVLQAAGRVIRTENDRGIIALLDYRFADSQYRNVFPKEWQGIQKGTGEKLGEVLEQFWEREPSLE